MKERTNERTT